MRKYYGVAGTKGYGVYNNWYQARNARRYTPHYKVNKNQKRLYVQSERFLLNR